MWEPDDDPDDAFERPSPSGDDGPQRTTSGAARNVVVFFFALLVVFGTIVVFTLIDRFIIRRRGCWRSFLELRDDTVGRMQNATSEDESVAKQAGLAEMTKAERRRILERVLISETYKSGRCRKLEQEEETGNDGKCASDVESQEVQLDKGRPKSSDCHGQSEDSTPCAQGSQSTGECAICINDYEEGEQVITGQCSHMFHRSCLLEWLDEHDVCPYCREPMMTPDEMKEAAQLVLGKERVVELGREQSGPPNDCGANMASFQSRVGSSATLSTLADVELQREHSFATDGEETQIVRS